MASYIEQTLEQGESIIHKGRLHWTYNWKWAASGIGLITLSAVLLILTLKTDFLSSLIGEKATYIIYGVIAFAGLCVWLWGYFIRSKTEFAITNTRFIQKDGIFNVKMMEIPLFKIETINFSQSFAERIFKTGKLQLVGSGGTDHTVSYLQRPHRVRKILMANMKDSKTE